MVHATLVCLHNFPGSLLVSSSSDSGASQSKLVICFVLWTVKLLKLLARKLVHMLFKVIFYSFLVQVYFISLSVHLVVFFFFVFLFWLPLLLHIVGFPGRDSLTHTLKFFKI